MLKDPLSNAIHKTLNQTRRVAVVGYNDDAVKLGEQLKRKGKYSFQGYFENDKSLFQNSHGELLGPLDYCITLAKEKKISEFYISIPYNEKNISNLAAEAEKHCIRVHFVAPENNHLNVTEIPENGFYRVHYFKGFPILKRYREPLRRLTNLFLKRVFDIAISSLVIVFILSWMIPLVSLLIKLESRGMVFFKQLRSGRDNNSFWCLKFRSMIPNSVSESMQASRYDNRVTKMGSFLRKTSLDEFPQFINVFRGEMSIVGPRPHMLKHTEEYCNQVERYMARLYLKPGVTGWAQVNGYRGEITDIELMKKRVEHDIWYMENWSIWLDIKILYLTFINVLQGEDNAY